MSKKTCDFAIIGGGVLGMNIARRLLNHVKGSRIIILDKNNDINNEPCYEITGAYSLNNNNFKAKLFSENTNLLKEFCNENNFYYLKSDQVILTKNQKEDEILKKNIIPKASHHQIQEPITLEKAKSKQFYINQNAALVDSTEIKSYLSQAIVDDNIDYRKKANIDKITKNGSTYTISTKKSEIEAKFLINVSGLDALNYAKQIGDYDYKQFNYTYTYYKLPNQLNFKKIYTSVPYLLHSGINLFRDYDDFPVLGPVINLSVKQDSILGKLRSLREYYKFLRILVNNEHYEMNICYNHPYKAKVIFQPYLNIYYVIGTEKIHKVDIKNVLIQNNKIVDDIIIEKSENAIHLLNNNMEDNEISLFLAISENLIKIIK
jgi:L-2-hydroxyglutarate oxidase